MIEYEATSDDLRIIKQRNQNIYAKVQLLNKTTMRTLAEIGGIVTDGSITIDAQSITRKSANLTMHVTDDFVGIGKNKMIWFDKYIKSNVSFMSKLFSFMILNKKGLIM